MRVQRGKRRGVVFYPIFICVVLISTLPFVSGYGGYGGGGGSGGSKPPPPPACPTYSAGCYDDSGASNIYYPGRLFTAGDPSHIANFDEYYSEAFCIDLGAECNCPDSVPGRSGIGSPFTERNAGACNCVGGVFDAAGCCGNNPNQDCGDIASNGQLLCSMQSDHSNPAWIRADASPGNIKYVPCENREYLSLDREWIKCDLGEQGKVHTFNGNEYICDDIIGRNNGWFECCGSGLCNSVGDGGRRHPGDPSPLRIDGKSYYCTNSGKWTDDLGSSQEACEGASFVWTGSTCCGDSSGEYFRDTDKGCWNSEAEGDPDFATIVEETDTAVLVHDGDFHGCNLDQNQPSLMQLDDDLQGGKIFTDARDHDYCEQDPSDSFFCDTDGEWTPLGSGDIQLANIPGGETHTEPSNCCPQDTCWNGDQCIDIQEASDPQVYFDKYRCGETGWEEHFDKQTPPPNNQLGFCVEDTQCLLDLTAATPCVEPLVFEGQHICLDGEWSTRTRIIALELLEHVGSDYVLICDETENTLNKADALLGSGSFSDFASMVNEICILENGNQVILATSLNEEFTNDHASEFFAVSNCNTARNNDDGRFHECDGRLRYNKKLEMIMYFVSGSAPSTSTTNLLTRIVSELKDVLEDIFDFAKDNRHADFSFVAELYNFDRLYMSKEGTKTIKGVFDVGTQQNGYIEYANFDENICNLPSIQAFEPEPGTGGVSCEQVGSSDTYVVHIQGSSTTSHEPQFDSWPDLTAKMR